MNQVHDVLINILEQFKDDFGKHLDKNENTIVNKINLRKILEVYNSIPSQLAKKIKSSNIRSFHLELIQEITKKQLLGLKNLA